MKEQSMEGLDAARVLFGFLQAGVYHFTYDDVLSACPALINLKPHTFRRWMSNPLYTAHKGTGLFTFNFRPQAATLLTAANNNALDLVVLYSGYDNFVRWVRIWSSPFVAGATFDNGKEKHRAIICGLRALHSACKGYTLAQLYTEGKQTLEDIYQLAYDYKGRHNYSIHPIESGRKTVVTIKRPLRKKNPAVRMVAGLPALPIDISLIIEA